MRAQTVANVIPIFVAPIPSLLHQNNIGVTYATPLNFKMELVKSMPLYCLAMPQFVITTTKALLLPTPIYTANGVKSKPQTPRGT
jgi:hypothetical protein